MTFGFIQILCVVWAVPIGKNHRKLSGRKIPYLNFELQAAYWIQTYHFAFFQDLKFLKNRVVKILNPIGCRF